MPASPDGVRDELISGRNYDRTPWPAFLARRRRVLAVATVIASLAAAVIVLSSDRASSPYAQRPAPVKLLNGNTISFRLNHATGAELDVQYFRARGGPESAWITLAATGLPRGYDYIATAGGCGKDGPRVLASASGLPDPVTDVLLLPLDNIAASEHAVLWVRVANPAGAQLGGVRSPFLLPHQGGAIAPGQPVCP